MFRSPSPGRNLRSFGPNGAGKTTALRILSTVLQPTSGVARVNGFDVSTHPYEVRHSIGFVSNNTAIYERMTAWEMVEYFGKLYGMESDRLEERMNRVFEQLQMNDIRDIAGARMSTGMQQKVNIARAIVHDPPVLVFDEARLVWTFWLRGLYSKSFPVSVTKENASFSRLTSCVKSSGFAIASVSCTEARCLPMERCPN